MNGTVTESNFRSKPNNKMKSMKADKMSKTYSRLIDSDLEKSEKKKSSSPFRPKANNKIQTVTSEKFSK